MEWIYYSRAEWWHAACSAIGSCGAHLWRALGRLLQFILTVILGVASIIAYANRQLCAFCRREMVASIIIGAAFVLMGFGWLSTYIQARSREVGAQHRADSLAYTLSKYMQAFDSTQTIVVDGDTIQLGRPLSTDK